MKKLLITATLSLATVAAFAQGSMNFLNFSTATFAMPIFAPDTTNPSLELHGQGTFAGSIPLGTVVYTGSALQGTGFTLQVWTGSTAGDIAPVYTTSFRTASSNKLPAGLVSGLATVTFAGVVGGDHGWYDVRVWDNLGGTVTTWAAATQGAGAWGESGAVQSQALGGIDATGGVHPISPNSTDWTSFNIHTVPEPTSLALLGLGAAGMMIFRRRK